LGSSLNPFNPAGEIVASQMDGGSPSSAMGCGIRDMGAGNWDGTSSGQRLAILSVNNMEVLCNCFRGSERGGGKGPVLNKCTPTRIEGDSVGIVGWK